ncbi:MAG TPA: hypothetical protein VKZ91_15440 [Woeseiaceae bacterium]|nr:hypothetical protein [Woeseiaceae bacterium]
MDALGVMREDVAALPDLTNIRHSAMMRASFAVERPLANNPLAPLGEIDAPLYYQVLDDFASAWTMIAEGALADARQAHARIQQRIEGARVLSVEEGLHEDDSATSEDDYLMARIIDRQIEALLAFHAGDAGRALELMGQALEDETGRAPYYGPPHIPKPSDELAGEMLLALERPAEAAAKFEKSLARHTNRTLSLLGLARAQEAAGDQEAAETWSLIEAQWRGGPDALRDVSYSWLPEVLASAARQGLLLD